MRTTPFLFSILAATLISAGAVTAQAAEGVFYDPSNAASPTGKTIGYELKRTIGCPGRGILDAPCPIPEPVDSDGDGVIDSKDKCPSTPAGRKVDADGCELDGDRDGIVDALDKCPNTPAGRKVDAQGCELDSDGDGIVDALDKCPTIFAKTADGCPLPVVTEPAAVSTVAPVAAPVAVGKLVLEGVNFDNDESVLRLDAYPILDRVARSLKDWGDVNIEIAGHTDSVGTDEDNLALSQRRAETVRAYLINRGIVADRLIAKGYGESQPVADNETAEGRFQNRRVELEALK